MKIILRYLPLFFLACVFGCQTTSQNWSSVITHATVKRSLPEVIQAIQLSCPQGVKVKTLIEMQSSKLNIANDIPEKSYGYRIHKNGNWFVCPKTIIVSATAVNSDETVVTVRAESILPFSMCGYVPPRYPERYPEIEKHTLDRIIKTLNQTTTTKSVN